MIYTGAEVEQRVPVPVREVTARAMDVIAVAADAVRKEVVASVATASGYELVGLDPKSLATQWSLPLPSYALRLIVSDDSSMLYALLPDAAAVVQVHLPTRTIVRTFATADGLAPMSAAVRPGAPGTVVVTTGRPQFVSSYDRTQVYDDGVPRPRYVGFDSGPNNNGATIPLNEIAFTDANQLAGHNNESTACGVVRLTLTPDGLVQGFYDNFKFSGGECFFEKLSAPVPGKLITNGGRNIDPVTLEDLDYVYGSTDYLYGDGLFVPGRNSFVRLQPGGTTMDGRHYVTVSEWDTSERRVLTRRVSLASPVVLDHQRFNPSTAVASSAAIGESRMVVALYDRDQVASGVLLSVDLAELPARSPLPLEPATAQSTSYTSWSLQLPALEMGYDPSTDRLVASLSAEAGPDGNSLAVIHPDTGVVERLIRLPGEPFNTRISSTGSLAYVVLRSMFRIVVVDLKTGNIVSGLRARSYQLAIKPDDSNTIAMLEFDDHYTFTMKQMTSFVAAPIVLTDQNSNDASSLSQVGWMAPLDNDRFVALTNTGEAWLLSWTPTGLKRDAVRGRSSGAGSKPHLAFGRMCFGTGGALVDAVTGTPKGRFDWSDDCAIPSESQVILGDHDSVPTNNIRLRWFSEPPVPNADLEWTLTGQLRIFDQRYETSRGPNLQVRLQLAGPSRVVHYGIGVFDEGVGVIHGVRRK